jgi:hypothetical protein
MFLFRLLCGDRIALDGTKPEGVALMTRPAYKRLIEDRLKGLPVDTLAEVVDFVDFLRMRAGKGAPRTAGRAERRTSRLLESMRAAEEAHLEEEFRGYAQKYPRE